MGQSLSCVSVAPHPRGSTLDDLEAQLHTGDIVMLLDGSKSSRYLLKASPVGGWSTAARCGFLVREGPGPAGLRLFHADAAAGPGQALVSSAPLAQELASGRWRAAVFRRLRRRLSPDQAALVREFALLNVGNVVEEDAHPSSVLMAPAAASPAAAVECLSCSDFVAMMLHLAGLAEPNAAAGAGEYLATDERGRLVGPPLALRLRGQPGGDGGSPGSTPTAASSARSSFGDAVGAPPAAVPVAG